MKYNPKAVATLQPDYLGFIFWEKSARYFDGQIPPLPFGTKKIGVFVNASLSEVLEKVKKYHLNGVQLHGQESPEYCKNLKKALIDEVSTAFDLIIIKVFSIKDTFDFNVLEPYEEVCDYYLFDTKGKLPGGNGYTFDWSVLKDYPSTKPYFLSGGIRLNEADALHEFSKRPESRYCHAIDVNSGFESRPGFKKIDELEKFKNLLTDKE